jgi:type II secretory pathway predicted ATPase ExeA
VTYSVVMPKLAPEEIEAFVLGQFDRAGLGHNTFTEDALALLVRSSDGILRRARNLCLSALIEAVRDQVRTVDLKQVNRVLMQPHWRRDHDIPSA